MNVKIALQFIKWLLRNGKRCAVRLTDLHYPQSHAANMVKKIYELYDVR